MKLAGRDAGKECLIVDVLDKNFVLIDGNTRRRKCNIKHLELLPKTAKLKAKAGHEDVAKALSDLGFKIVERTAKPAKKTDKKEAKVEPKKTLKEKLADKKAERKAKKK